MASISSGSFSGADPFDGADPFGDEDEFIEGSPPPVNSPPLQDDVEPEVSAVPTRESTDEKTSNKVLELLKQFKGPLLLGGAIVGIVFSAAVLTATGGIIPLIALIAFIAIAAVGHAFIEIDSENLRKKGVEDVIKDVKTDDYKTFIGKHPVLNKEEFGNKRICNEDYQAIYRHKGNASRLEDISKKGIEHTTEGDWKRVVENFVPAEKRELTDLYRDKLNEIIDARRDRNHYVNLATEANQNNPNATPEELRVAAAQLEETDRVWAGDAEFNTYSDVFGSSDDGPVLNNEEFKEVMTIFIDREKRSAEESYDSVHEKCKGKEDDQIKKILFEKIEEED